MIARAALTLLLLAAAAAPAAELGRLFFTPAQRAALDAARKQNVRVEIANEDTERPQQPAAPAPRDLSVNGLIQRSDGKSTVWVNNKPLAGDTAGGYNVTTRRGDNRVNLTAPDGGRSVQLKVGQTLEVQSGTVEEGFRRRAAAAPEEKPATPPAPAAAATDNSRESVQKRTAEPPAGSLESSRLQRKPRGNTRETPEDTASVGTEAPR